MKMQKSNQLFSDFSSLVRSSTLDIKVQHSWKYHEDGWVKCQLEEENMDHFSHCTQYENKHEALCGPTYSSCKGLDLAKAFFGLWEKEAFLYCLGSFLTLERPKERKKVNCQRKKYYPLRYAH